jgi:uncharacterized protein
MIPNNSPNTKGVPKVLYSLVIATAIHLVYYLPLSSLAYLTKYFPFIFNFSTILDIIFYTIAIYCLFVALKRNFSIKDTLRLFKLPRNSILPLICIAIALELFGSTSRGLLAILGSTFFNNQNIITTLPASHDLGILAIALTVIFVPVFEESIFRGLLLSSFEQKYGDSWAILITSLLFTFIHHSIISFPFLYVESFILAWLLCRGYSIYAAIIIHAFHNGWVLIKNLMPNGMNSQVIDINSKIGLLLLIIFIISIFLIVVCFRWLMFIIEKNKIIRQDNDCKGMAV